MNKVVLFIFFFSYSFGQNTSFLEKGIKLYNKNEWDSSIYYFKKNVKIHALSHDTIKANDYLYIAKNYKAKQNYIEAFKYYNLSEKIFKKANNYNKLAETYALIAEFYRSKFDYKEAKKHILISEKIIQTHSVSKKIQAYFWNRKAAIIIEYDKDIKGTLECSNKVLKLAKELQDKELEASSLNEIGYVYENLNNPIAQQYYKKALKIYEDEKNYQSQVDVIVNLSRLYHKQNRLLQNKIFIDKGFKIASEKKFNAIIVLFYNQYYRYYLDVKDFEKALFYLELYHKTDKEDLKRKWNKQIIDAEKKYDFEKNQIELKQKESEILKKQSQTLTLTILLLIALLLIGFIIYFFRKTKAQNKKLELLSNENVFLMAEANHRINNNLQLIIILIKEELKKASIENNVQIKKILSKVDAIATLHKHLYHGNDKQNIDIQKYLKDIQINFFEAFKENKVQTNFTIESFSIKVDTAMYFGLLLTELSINSLKHAFHNQEEKIINFSLKKANNLVKFSFSDNGCGTENDVVLKLVDKLCRQLKIEYQMNTKNNFQFTFEKEFK